jgi:uncharacterized protein YecT (DUF1311 family)
MRKASEAAHDVAMALGTRRIRRPQMKAQRYAPLLVGEIFGMAEGQIEKCSQLFRHMPVAPRVNRCPCNPARRGIRRIHGRRAAERVAGKLIQQQQQRQCAFRGRQPAVEIAARRGFMRLEKRLAETAIEIRILGEPQGRAGLPPELDYCGSGHGRHLRLAGSEISAGMEFLLDESHAEAGVWGTFSDDISSPSVVGDHEKQPAVAPAGSGVQKCRALRGGEQGGSVAVAGIFDSGCRAQGRADGRRPGLAVRGDVRGSAGRTRRAEQAPSGGSRRVMIDLTELRTILVVCLAASAILCGACSARATGGEPTDPQVDARPCAAAAAADDADKTIAVCGTLIDNEKTPRAERIKALIARAGAYARTDQTDRAIGDYDTVLGLDPTLADIFNTRGELWRKKGDRPRALQDFAAAIKLNPDHSAAKGNHKSLAQELERLGAEMAVAGKPSFDCATARRPVEKAICADPDLANLDREIDGVNTLVVRENAKVSRRAGRALQRAQDDFITRRNARFGQAGYDLHKAMKERLRQLVGADGF